MPKAPAKTAPAKKPAPVKAAPPPPVVEQKVEESTREAPAMEAADEPTDFDNLVDLARAIDPKFGSEGAKEGSNHFLIRLLTALADSTTEQFESLSLSAQTWYENAVQEGNDKKDITPPDGYATPTVVAKEAVVKNKAAAKTPKEKKEKKVKEPKVREASKTMPVRLAVCANPKITLDELIALLPAIGKSTLSTTRSDTLATLEAARNSGWAPTA